MFDNVLFLANRYDNRNIEARIKDTISKLNTLPLVIEKQDLPLSKNIADLEITAINTISKTQENFKELEEKHTEFENKLKELADEYTAQNESNKTLVENFQKELNEKSNEFKYDLNDKYNEFINEKSEPYLKELKAKLEEAKKIVNIVGNIGVTGNYQKIANYNRKQANIFRGVSLFVMAILIILIGINVYHLDVNDLNWKYTLIKFLATALLLYPATYAAKESNKHRELENLNRKLELELASIGPFIELLPEEKK